MVMRAMRAGTKPILWIVVIAFVGTIIFAWGMQFSAEPTRKGIIARVNGNDILQQEYLNVFNALYQQRQADNPNAEFDEATLYQLREQAFNELVRAKLYAEQVNRFGINVTSEELAEHLRRFPPQELQSIPDFQTNGQFDYGKYQQQFANPDPRFWMQVESFVRPRLTQMKLSEQVSLLARVSDPEVRMYFDAGQEKASVNIALIRSAPLIDEVTEPTQDEVSSYYEKHKEEYKRGETIELHYVDFAKKPSSLDTADVKRDLEEVIKDLKDGQDFGELAKIYSEDVTASNGGDLGWFRSTDMVKPFGDAVKAMKPGTVSEPVLTNFGWHLIKLYETREAKADTTEYKASHILIRIRPSPSTLSDLRLAAEGFAESAKLIGFDSAAIAANILVKSTGEFERGDSPRNLGRQPVIENWGFQEDVGAISDPFDLAESYAICELIGHNKAGIPPLDEMSTEIKQLVRLEKAKDVAYSKLQPVWDKVSAGATLKAACEEADIQVLTPPPFGRFDRISGIGDDPIIKGVTFGLTQGDSLSGVFKSRTGAAIVELISRSEPNLSRYAETRDSLYTTALQAKQQMVYNGWFGKLYDEAKIEDFRYQLEGGGI